MVARNAGISGFAPDSSAAAIGDVLIVTVVEIGPPFGVTDAGEKLQDAPTGNPEQLKETTELKPFRGVNETVKELLWPAVMVSDEDDVVMEKS
jgi:hypothetical protein